MDILSRLLRYDPRKFLSVTRILLRFLVIWSVEGSILVMRIVCIFSLSVYTIVGMISFLYRTDEDIVTYAVTLSMFSVGFHSIIEAFWLIRNYQNNLFSVTRTILRCLGIWSEEGSILVMRIVCILSLSAYMIVGAISFLYRTDDDIVTFGITLCMAVCGFLGIIKALWYFYNSKKIGWLIHEMERITIENISIEKLHRQEFIKAVDIPKGITFFLLFMVAIVLGIETLYCLFVCSNDSRMMFNLYSFIDPKRYYFLALAFQYFYWIWPLNILIITFNLLMCFIMVSVANLSVLECNLRSVPSNLSRTVNLHNEIISFVKVMNEVLKPAIICELVIGILTYCISGYMCVESVTLRQKCISYASFVCGLVVPWFICHYGSILEEKSAKLTDAVYSSAWIELKPKQRKEIIILMISTNKPLQIKLSSTHVINYDYYTSFIQITYSFFTLLLSVNSN